MNHLLEKMNLLDAKLDHLIEEAQLTTAIMNEEMTDQQKERLIKEINVIRDNAEDKLADIWFALFTKVTKK